MEAIHQELQLTIQRSFRKCGITVAIDGSEDDQIKIRGLDNYQVPRSIDLGNAEGPSDPSEASDSDSAVSLEEEIID